MINRDYVRLGLACVAAVGVHGLFFWQTSNPTVVVPDQSLIHVQLMPQPIHQERGAVQHDDVKTVFDKPSNNQISFTQKNVPHSVAKVSHVKAQDEPSKKLIQQQVKAKPQWVSEDIQSLVLTHLHYPRRAIYRGWQGKAELQFGVVESVVQNISLFTSTGFDVLDQAAFQALASMEYLPLNDGLYKLPVVFKLQ